ncbi:hypothetical protein [Thalassobaculum litoreum]|nr:hypothetical protein [Thalassobaculum litoreum]
MKKSPPKTAEIRALRPDLASTARRPGENPPPPRHLTVEAKAWWSKIVEEYGLDDDAGLLLLTVALEAFCRMRGAQSIIKREGASCRDRFGQLKANPMLVVERDSRAGMITALGKLNLDLEPLANRPSGGRR